METITSDDFSKLDIRIGTVVDARKVPGADKLLRLSVDVAEAQPRQIISGIAEYVNPEDLIGTQCPFLLNIAPRKLRGVVSNGMMLAASGASGGFALLHPSTQIESGSSVH